MNKEWALACIAQEHNDAVEQHPAGMRSIHEGFAILQEEVDELWDEIKLKRPDKDKLRKEALQVGAMALRFLVDLT